MEIELNYKILAEQLDRDPHNPGMSDSLERWVYLTVDYDSSFHFNVNAYEEIRLVKYTGKILSEKYGDKVYDNTDFSFSSEYSLLPPAFDPGEINERVADFIKKNVNKHSFLEAFMFMVKE